MGPVLCTGGQLPGEETGEEREEGKGVVRCGVRYVRLETGVRVEVSTGPINSSVM